MKGNQLLYMVLPVLLQCGEKSAGSSVLDSAVHYWPFDRDRGVVDVATNISGVKYGKLNNIYIKGPTKGFLHTDGRAWEDLGNFTGTCLAEPWRCTNGLTVFLWLKYYPHINKRYFVGTASHLSSSQGFSIYKESNKRRNNSIVVAVNDGRSEWTGYVTHKPGIWLHIAFTWNNSTGLALFENCRQIALVSEGKVKSYRSNNKSKFLEQHLTLSGGIKSHPNAGTRASYDDLTVLYRELKQQEWNDICFYKLEAPQLRESCQSFTRHLVVKWKPPSLTYNILEGFKVWLSGNSTTLEWTEVFDLGSEETSFNFSGLEPGSAYKIRVQNSFRFGDGKASRTIECKTVKEVLDPPANFSAEMTSSTAILLSWDASGANSKWVLGYKIMYNVLDSEEEFNKVTVAPLTSFLITKLSKDTKYRIQMFSFSDHRFADSRPAVATARTDPYSTKSVTKLKTQLLGARTMQISWNKPPAKYKIFGYRVYVKWSTLDQRKNMLTLYDGNKTACTYALDNNIPSSLTFHVMARVIREIPPIPVQDPPINVTLVSVGWSYLTLNWTSPFQKTTVDFADMYRVIVTSRNDKIVITTTTTYARVDGLKQLTNYFVNVQAGNELGFGPFISKDINVRTPDRDECTVGSHVCHMSAVCANTVGSYTCECKPGFIGDGNQCEDEPEEVGDSLFCPKQSLAGIEWRNTLVDRLVVMKCPNGTLGRATRSCNGPYGAWQLPDLSDCVSGWMTDISKQLTSPNVSVLSVAKEVSNFTNVKSGKPLYAGDLKLLVDTIGLLSRKGFESNTADESKTFIEAVVGTASNILDNKHLKSWTYMPKDSQLEKAGSLITSLDTLALNMANSSQREPEKTDNVVISVTSLSEIRNLRGLEMRQISATEENSVNAVLFPASVLRGKHSSGEKPSYATFVSYKTLGPLLTPRGNKRDKKDEIETMNVNSAVLSLNLQPLTERTFNDPVVITLRHSVENEGRRNKPTCAFLENEKNGSWSKAGCKVKTTNKTHTVCHCYHLTSFAVLMSVRKDVSTSISEEHQLALSLITYVGVSISIIALILAFLTFHFFRFSTSARTFIHKDLAVSLIFAQLVFLFGISKTENQSVCKGIAVALHYFFLVSFSWMALEGVMLYLMLVKVFHTKTAPTKTKKIFFCIGWGLPVAIVVTSGVLFHEGYGTSSYCWLTLERGFIWSFVGPVLLVLMFNFVILGMTFNVMARRGPTSNKRRTSKIRKWSKACMLLTCILGLTWLFGVFYINQESLFMAYFFTIFNTLQGLFIFLFHCIGDAKVRREYRRVLCCVSRAKQPLLSNKSDTSKSESSSRPSKSYVDNLKNKNQTISSSASSLGTIESRKNTFVVHVTDGEVRVRGVPLDNSSSDHRTTQRQSQASFSSFGQPSEQNRDSIRQSVVSRTSEFHENKQEVQTQRDENWRNAIDTEFNPNTSV